MAPDVGARGGDVAFVFVGSDFALVAGGLPGEGKRVGEGEEGEEGYDSDELHGGGSEWSWSWKMFSEGW